MLPGTLPTTLFHKFHKFSFPSFSKTFEASLFNLISDIKELTVLNLTKLGPWEAGNIVKNIVKVSYH